MADYTKHHTPDTGSESGLLTSGPQRIIRWAVATLFLLIGICLLLCTLIKYPDLISTDITINAVNKPEPQLEALVVNQNGTKLSTSISIGRELNLKTGNYTETGLLKGIITGLSKNKNEDSCLVTISLPHGFTSSFHKQVIYEPGMKGIADILVKDHSIMDHLITSFKKKYFN